MIISRSLQYVYIGIPRTGSKSMNRWLMTHCQGEWFGTHHDWRVPDFAKDYLIFTTVRNPYDRAVSGYFAIPWDGKKQRDEFREQVPFPEKSTNPLTKIIQEAMATQAASNGAEVDMSQKDYVDRAGVSLALYFERLPNVLYKLPFVNKAVVAEFPHVLERGIRPPGTFFDFFSTEDEASYWAYVREEFEAFGYQRFDCGLPAESPDAFYLR